MSHLGILKKKLTLELNLKDKGKKKKERLSIENDIIHIFNSFDTPIMNKIIPNVYKLNTLAFLK